MTERAKPLDTNAPAAYDAANSLDGYGVYQGARNRAESSSRLSTALDKLPSRMRNLASDSGSVAFPSRRAAFATKRYIPPSEGRWWTILSGSTDSLRAAFNVLERSPNVDRLCRHPKRELLGARVTLTPEDGQGYWELTRIRDDVYVIVRNYIYKRSRVERLPADGFIHFNFKISGDVKLAVSQTESLRFNRPSLLVWAQSQAGEIPEWTTPGTPERTVVISIRPDSLIEDLAAPASELPPPLPAFIAGPCSRLNYCQFPLTAQMVEMVTRLLQNPFNGTRALMYIEALTLELICAAIGSFSAPSAATAEYGKRELRCLEAARNMLMRQFTPAPTIRKLARSVGLAETALTAGFKAVYGETPFEFSLRCRMQHAIILLRDHRWPVGKVSDAVGYSHSTSFATAFRRHFGIRPIDVRGARYTPRQRSVEREVRFS